MTKRKWWRPHPRIGRARWYANPTKENEKLLSQADQLSLRLQRQADAKDYEMPDQELWNDEGFDVDAWAENLPTPEELQTILEAKAEGDEERVQEVIQKVADRRAKNAGPQ